MRVYNIYIVATFSRGNSLKTTDEIKLPRHRKRRRERRSVGILNHHRSELDIYIRRDTIVPFTPAVCYIYI